ncbi:regulatory-associated protein of mTOR isoform X2 [Aethina tumida]|uniref:regulatory-associated protein of mTOR isoform X2 n=1 Tax=Aethina tumida TaxID=116153 RepID=UPI00096B246A|nr:regulatory-associated protein of mTOR isoform X2 [Aethina tumida]
MGSADYNEENEKVQDHKNITDRDLPLSFVQDRHIEPIEGIDYEKQAWRMKERMKTVSVALVLCLNVGVDPPDVVKTQPCARLECWIDPLSMSPQKALDKIGSNLQTQYERWQPRARYKQSLDPTSDEVKKLCSSLRRNAKEERVLFHYNGHGVPKPTENGEIWVFNRTFTQYIPLSIYDLQSWMGAPSIYVYDCSNAGIIVKSFKKFACQHESEFEIANAQARGSSPAQRGGSPAAPSYSSCIQLAACAENQVLPMNPDLPADLFTACLTTPIKVALRWWKLQPTAKLVPRVSMEQIEQIPGLITDRRTMLGELNWIFTAITDTIAWNVLPRDLFQKLFRQDLLVASLFRNFLLAERIMRSCDCTPVSSPQLPPTYLHHMWVAWDLTLDLSMAQLPDVVSGKKPFQHLPFFEEQLTAFQVWLELGSESRDPPEQLPIVLQVLLSQVHRMRALELLGRFLDLGPWAVNLALSVGIFPYVLKLLQSSAKELRPLLVKIWAKILAVDKTCQSDLVRDNGHKYFLTVLQDTSISSEHRTQATFVLASIVTNFKDGQEAALQGSLISICLEQLNDPCPHLRQWVAICLGRLWDRFDSAKWIGVRDIAHEKLYTPLKDPYPEVRAAAVYALGTFINSVGERSEHANNIDHGVVMKLVTTVMDDMSPLVRKELVNALQWVVLTFEQSFVSVARKEAQIVTDYGNVSTPTSLRRIASRDKLRVTEDSMDRMKRVNSSSSINNMSQQRMTSSHSGSLGTLPGISFGSVYMKIWMALLTLETDPHPEVASLCNSITHHIRSIVKEQNESAENRMNSSISLPPSPNRMNYLSGESPPTLHPNHDLHRFNNSRSQNRSRRLNQVIMEDEEKSRRSALVKTSFVEWSAKRFAQKKNGVYVDPESQKYYDRDWRQARNCSIRQESMEEVKRVGTSRTSRIESQVFHTKTALAPSLLQLHPFDQQIAVAGKDSFAIWDWGTGAKTSSGQCKSTKSQHSRITALEWINGHDSSMLMTASDDGSVKLFKPIIGSQPSLISAWQAFNDLKQPKQSGVLLSWEQWTQTLMTAGDHRAIRFWDVEREMRAFDIPTGTDASVTAIDSTFAGICHETSRKYARMAGLAEDMDGSSCGGPRSGYVAVGCSDGSVRLFDRRVSSSCAPVRVWMELNGSVLAVLLRDNMLICGSSDGQVKMFDIRKGESIHKLGSNIPVETSCMAIHRSATTYACGSLSQYVNIYHMNGEQLNSIRFYEGFMGHRIGPVICLNYHPHKMALATGTSDCSINVYTLEARR